MATEFVREIATGTSARQDATSTRVVRIWHVKLTVPDYGNVAALTAVDPSTAETPPKVGDGHPLVPYATVTDLSADPIGGPEDRINWLVTANYKTKTYRARGSEPVENPLEEPPAVNWGFRSSTEPVYEDRDGNPIANSAGDAFDPTITEEVFNLEVTITRNEETYDADQAAEYINTINDAQTIIAGHTAAKWEARLSEYSAQKAEKNGQEYWVVTYRVEFNEDTFIREVLDQGLREKDGSTMKKITESVKGVSGKTTITEPVKLDGSGAELAVGAAAHYQSFRTLEEKDFDTLQLNV
jgi:hypothetical protein